MYLPPPTRKRRPEGRRLGIDLPESYLTASMKIGSPVVQSTTEP